MRFFATCAVVLAAGLGLSACTSDDFVRTEGVTTSAGDAVASNTVLQMVDPWPQGVQDTDLRVPANRPSSGDTGASDGGSASEGMTGSTFN